MWLCGSPLPDYIRSIRPKRYLDNWSFRDMDIYMYWEFGFANSSRGFKHTMVLPSSSISGMWHMTCTYIIFVCEQIQSNQKLYENNYIYIYVYYLDTLVYITMPTWVEFQFLWPFTRRNNLLGSTVLIWALGANSHPKLSTPFVYQGNPAMM